MVGLRWRLVAGLCGAALLAAGGARGEALARVAYPSAALSFSRAAPDEERRSKLSPEVVFQVTGPVRVEEGRWAVLAGELVNPLRRPAKVVVFAGNGDTPFTLGPLLEGEGGEVRWRPPRPGEILLPPVPAPPFRLVIPPRTVVAFFARFDLDRLDYAGEPDLELEWRFGFLQRPNLVDQVRLRLPGR